MCEISIVNEEKRKLNLERSGRKGRSQDRYLMKKMIFLLHKLFLRIGTVMEMHI